MICCPKSGTARALLLIFFALALFGTHQAVQEFLHETKSPSGTGGTAGSSAERGQGLPARPGYFRLAQVKQILRESVREGAVQYNKNKFCVCADLYARAADVLVDPEASVPTKVLELLMEARSLVAQDPETGRSEAGRCQFAAWQFRYAFDDIMELTSETAGDMVGGANDQATEGDRIANVLKSGIAVGPDGRTPASTVERAPSPNDEEDAALSELGGGTNGITIGALTWRGPPSTGVVQPGGEEDPLAERTIGQMSSML